MDERMPKRIRREHLPGHHERSPSKRKVRLPKRLREDIVPDAPAIALPSTTESLPNLSSASFGGGSAFVRDHSHRGSAESSGGVHEGPPDSPEATTVMVQVKTGPFVTPSNAFGVYRVYDSEPEGWQNGGICSITSVDDLQHTTAATITAETKLSAKVKDLLGPYRNPSQFLFHHFALNNPHTDAGQGFFDDFRLQVLLHPRFRAADLAGPSGSMQSLNRRLDDYGHNDDLSAGEFKTATLELAITINKQQYIFKDAGLELRHRSLLALLKASHETHKLRRHFEYMPWKSFSKPTSSRLRLDARLFDEVFSSDSWLAAHREVLALPVEEGCSAPRGLMAFKVYSDATQLGQFGSARATPVQVTNLHAPKRLTQQLSSKLTDTVCFLPELPATFGHWLSTLRDDSSRPLNKTQTVAITRKAKQDLFHECFRALFDAEYMDAHHHGVLIRCDDGITRRLYPRLLIYSADYEEKVVVATVKHLGRCPCPRCFVRLADIAEKTCEPSDLHARRTRLRHGASGALTDQETAIRYISQGAKITGTQVGDLLKPISMTPTKNAFYPIGTSSCSIFRALLPDQMHELELGVFKDFFEHLVRLVEETGLDRISEMNARFRAVPKYGEQAIRRFPKAVASLTNLAARDFAAILKCLSPVVRGLPRSDAHEAIVLDACHHFSGFHALAKLRIHSSRSLKLLEEAAQELARSLRRFQKEVCPAYGGYETAKEQQKRWRSEAHQSATQAASSSGALPSNDANSLTPQIPGAAPAPQATGLVPYRPTRVHIASGSQAQDASEPAGTLSGGHHQDRKKIDFSLSKYKFHAIGDYASAIRWAGSVHNFSTESGELHHRRIKRDFRLTNKNSGYTHQLLQKASRRDKSQQILAGLQERRCQKTRVSGGPGRRVVPFDELAAFSSTEPYTVAEEAKNPIHMGTWLRLRSQDPALQRFRTHLLDHLFVRLEPSASDRDERSVTPDEQRLVKVQRDTLYQHATLRVNFTTYDMTRESDIIHIGTDRCDVMVASLNDDASPFWWGRVIMVFHVYAFVNKGVPKRVDVCWVRWFEPLGDREALRPQDLRFAGRLDAVDTFDDDSMGFIDPACIVRGAHIVPHFQHGVVENPHPSVVVSPFQSEYHAYLVTEAPDGDMFARFLNHPLPGHRSSPYLLSAEQSSDGAPESECALVVDDEEESDLSASVDVIDERRRGVRGDRIGNAMGTSQAITKVGASDDELSLDGDADEENPNVCYLASDDEAGSDDASDLEDAIIFIEV